MKTKNPILIGRVLLIAILLLSPNFACKKYLEVGMPKTELAAQAVFESDATANAAMAGIYIKAGGFASGVTGSISQLGAYFADECDNYQSAQAVVQLSSNKFIPSNTYTTGLWNSCYSTIYLSNAMLAGLKDNAVTSAPLAKQLSGEALFFRALSHFYLTSFYGRVPIVTSSDYRENTLISQSDPAAVYAQVISDLESSKAMLAENYAGWAGERVRVTRWAASALLARVYLYSGNYQKAKEESTLVIANTTLFSLPAPSDVFLKNSRETILAYKPTSTTANSGDGNIFVLTGKPTIIALKTAFYNSFEPGDLRRAAWTSKVTASSVDYYFPYKYKVKTGTVLTEYSVMLRLGEQYLIRAEAAARLNELPNAISDIDVIRNRAGISKIAIASPLISQPDLLDAILQQRKSELFTEWAHRWLDLKRFSRSLAALSPLKPDWKPYSLLLPLPDYDMRTNPMLIQNEGYQ